MKESILEQPNQSLWVSFWDKVDGKRNDLAHNFILFVKRIFTIQISTFILILGRRGTGKTDLALLFAEILYRAHIIKYIATNTKIIDSPFPITHIDNLEDLDYWGQTKKGRKLFIFDEIADAMSRRRPMARLTVELIKKFNKLRKHKLSIIATTISDSILDSAAMDQDLLDAVFNRPFFPEKHPIKCKIAYYNNFLTGESITLEDLPKTSVDFDSWDSSPFTEKPMKTKAQFKDKDMQDVYEYSQGKTCKDLGLHPMQINRKVRKILQYFFEKHVHVSHNKGSGK